MQSQEVPNLFQNDWANLCSNIGYSCCHSKSGGRGLGRKKRSKLRCVTKESRNMKFGTIVFNIGEKKKNPQIYI